jgi:hypothetical protein
MQRALCLRSPAFNWKARQPDHGRERDALVVDPDGNLVEFGQARGPEMLGSARRANRELML